MRLNLPLKPNNKTNHGGQRIMLIDHLADRVPGALQKLDVIKVATNLQILLYLS